MAPIIKLSIIELGLSDRRFYHRLPDMIIPSIIRIPILPSISIFLDHTLLSTIGMAITINYWTVDYLAIDYKTRLSDIDYLSFDYQNIGYSTDYCTIDYSIDYRSIDYRSIDYQSIDYPMDFRLFHRLSEYQFSYHRLSLHRLS